MFFSSALLILSSCSKNTDGNPAPIPGTTTDVDGNLYHSVTIGTQVWMDENLKTTKYNDGSSIPLVTDSIAWINMTTPGYCWYHNNAAAYKNTYGALYNWYAVNTGKLAPTGWHVPTDAEWTILVAYLGGELLAGGRIAWYRYLGYRYSGIFRYYDTKNDGFSVRCIRDN
ncbi:MAG: fibrobacter succinogenes major paralogous domain-containing protein [Bacteroidales bacterium]